MRDTQVFKHTTQAENLPDWIKSTEEDEIKQVC